MKDLPTTLKIIILVALLLSLVIILGQFFVESTEALRFEATVDRAGESMEKSEALLPRPSLYPPVPPVLPNLNEGYLFSGERKFEKVELEAENSGSGAVDLAEVVYAGSLIVGEVHRALITYKEKGPASRRAVGPINRMQKTSSAAGDKYKQLVIGENFMGYVVDKIEKDLIVFRKGDELVEKFLYDSKKVRAVGRPGTNASSASPVRALENTPEQPVQQIPSRRTVIRSTPAAPERVAPASGGEAPASVDVLRSMRSERLLELAPSLGMPAPGLSGDPMRR